MEITLKLFATLTSYLPEGSDLHTTKLAISEGDTVYSVLDRCRVPREMAHLVLLNGTYLQPEDRGTSTLKAGDTLAVWPAVAGG